MGSRVSVASNRKAMQPSPGQVGRTVMSSDISQEKHHVFSLEINSAVQR